MQARKEAIMSQVRSELALSNAQELINVRRVDDLFRCYEALTLGNSRKSTKNASQNA